ncbi:hypothetical protein GSI_00100 [Ganoderma sinense ZZ0214-1]|uniref:Uncharacterized protein n=1 Tax=Ganoderma sinense ZZ0214-1 TaxID=1077348 RepID=A0A2G8SRP2_9APHY|nr:hypothetical protein GSI_00100 [Ganoderma sinense ZZ0214-1]
MKLFSTQRGDTVQNDVDVDVGVDLAELQADDQGSSVETLTARTAASRGAFRSSTFYPPDDNFTLDKGVVDVFVPSSRT